MLNEAGAAAALTPNEVVAPISSSPTPPSPPPSPSGGDAGDSRVYLGTPCEEREACEAWSGGKGGGGKGGGGKGGKGGGGRAGVGWGRG